MQQSATRPAYPAAGALAGLAGAILIDAYRLVTRVVIAQETGPSGFYQHVASGLIGADAYRSADAVWLGVAAHLAISVAWAIGFAQVASRMPQVRARPVLSGAIFGIVVMIVMLLVELLAGIYVPLSANEALNELIAHTLFFGIPIALIVARRLRAA
ncbi:MAG: hypothetical protein ACREM2_11355 [Vulcanimicrobiaceae bacterium]